MLEMAIWMLKHPKPALLVGNLVGANTNEYRIIEKDAALES